MPEEKKIAVCRKCGEHILWVKTRKGKNMPIDYKPEFENDTEFKYGRHICHFSTCPNANDFRKGN